MAGESGGRSVLSMSRLASTPPPGSDTDKQIAASPSRPTVDEMGEWSFPASDPPATWTWDVTDAAHERTEDLSGED